jgi:hypothetical protein
MRSTDPGDSLTPANAPAPAPEASDIADVLDRQTLRDLAIAIWEWARAEHDVLVRERDALRIELQECRAALEALALRAERAIAALGHEREHDDPGSERGRLQ